MPFFETNDHTRLYYRDWGTGSPVVFVSAWALSGAMWEYQMVPLSDQGLRCIASVRSFLLEKSHPRAVREHNIRSSRRRLRLSSRAPSFFLCDV
jgi:pimeloyl-ACP methyl ester carboxylesterase